MTLRARISTIFDILLGGAGDLGSPEAPINGSFRQAFDTGGGVNQAHMAFGDERSIAGSGTDSLDLAGGLAGALGGNLTFTSIKEIFIKADEANAGNLKVGRGVTNAFVGPFGASAVGILVPPGGILHLRNPSAGGWAVTADTGDLLPVENAGGSTANYTAIIVGETS